MSSENPTASQSFPSAYPGYPIQVPPFDEATRGDVIMANQQAGESQSNRLKHFDEPELGSGARDTGEDVPDPGQGDRPVGTIDEDANPPMSDPTASDVYGGTGEVAPQDTGSAIPPYEGRQEAAQG